MGVSGSEPGGRRRGEVRAAALDDDTDIAGAADRARLVQRDAHPLEPELLEQQQGEPMRQRLDQLELRGLDVRQHALGDLLVVYGVGDIVARRSAATVHGQLEVDHDGLPDAPLPVDEADDALGRQPAQEDAVAGLNGTGHVLDRAASAPLSCCKGTAVSVSSGHWARGWTARPSRSPARSRARPATAIIAALSVQNSIRG